MVWQVGSPEKLPKGEALASWAELDAQMPEVRKVWRTGARHAEFGCGAGRDLVRIPAMYPRVEAVGYDILENVLKHARDLADRAGVADPAGPGAPAAIHFPSPPTQFLQGFLVLVILD